jgi:hypothetical protein
LALLLNCWLRNTPHLTRDLKELAILPPSKILTEILSPVTLLRNEL